MGRLFESLAWLVIVLSLISIVAAGWRTLHHCCNSAGCKASSSCNRMERPMKGGSEAASCSPQEAEFMSSCKMEGDSCIMNKDACEKLMGKEGCEKMMKERGRCIMSKEECSALCGKEGKSRCLEKNMGGCSMRQAACKGDCGGNCSLKCEGKCESGEKKCCAGSGEAKSCCKHKM